MLGNSKSIAEELSHIIEGKATSYVRDVIVKSKKQNGDCPNKQFVYNLFTTL